MSGLSWTVLQQVGQQVIQFAIQMTLARILLPSEFGLIAMMSVFISMGSMIAQAGMSSAIIQAKELSETDTRTTFTLNLILGGVIAGVLYFAAPWVSQFYEQPRLVDLMRVLSISVFIQQFGGVHGALLSRDLRYKELAMASVPALLLSGVVGVLAAFSGLGVWSLIIQSMSAAVITAGLQWKLSGWPVRLGFSISSFRSIFPYGWKIAANQILTAFFNNIYIIVIGKFFLASEVAYYQRAKSFQNLAVVNLMSVFNRVAFPLLSRLNADDEARMRDAYYKFLTVVGWVVLPSLAILAGLSEPMILVLLTEKWIQTAPYLQILCLIGMLLALNIAHANFMLAKGDAGVHLKLSITSKVLVVIALCFTYRSGITVMLWGHFVTSVIVNALLLYFLRLRYQISLGRILSLLRGPILVSLVTYLCARLVVVYLPSLPIADLLVGLASVSFFYWLGLFVFRDVFRADILAIQNSYPRIYQLMHLARLI